MCIAISNQRGEYDGRSKYGAAHHFSYESERSGILIKQEDHGSLGATSKPL